MTRTILFAAFAAAAVLAGPVAAAARDGKPRDPNEVICRKEEVTGSRLASRKVCQTRADWDEQRRLTQQDVEKFQRGTCQPGAGCTN